jgi:hypothetical protein
MGRSRTWGAIPFAAGVVTLLAGARHEARSVTPGSLAPPARPQANAPDSVMAPFAFLEGDWIPDSTTGVFTQNPDLRGMIVAQFTWIVGQKAFRFKENLRPDEGDGAELEGMVHWNPATEKVELVAVAGKGPGQGRLFVGEYRALADGRVERIYDVYYRTPADMPAESLGGSRRRYREILDGSTPNRIDFTLEWWLYGQWQQFRRGNYSLVRRGGVQGQQTPR